MRKIIETELDVAIVEGRVKARSNKYPEIKDYLVLVCSMSHPFAKQTVLSVLESENFAMREEGSGTRNF